MVAEAVAVEATMAVEAVMTSPAMTPKTAMAAMMAHADAVAAAMTAAAASIGQRGRAADQRYSGNESDSDGPCISHMRLRILAARRPFGRGWRAASFIRH
jgi:hypothetical protein